MKLISTAILAAMLAAPAFAQTAMPQSSMGKSDMMGKPMMAAPVAPHITMDTKLFQDFGGRAGLVAIMDDFMVNLLADARTRPFFENVDQAHVKAMLVEQFCEILNGGCTYSGQSMVDVHKGMGVKESHFLALVEDLQKAMDKHKVPFASQNKLLAALAPQHRDIIASQWGPGGRVSQ